MPERTQDFLEDAVLTFRVELPDDGKRPDVERPIEFALVPFRIRGEEDGVVSGDRPRRRRPIPREVE